MVISTPTKAAKSVFGLSRRFELEEHIHNSIMQIEMGPSVLLKLNNRAFMFKSRDFLNLKAQGENNVKD